MEVRNLISARFSKLSTKPLSQRNLRRASARGIVVRTPVRPVRGTSWRDFPMASGYRWDVPEGVPGTTKRAGLLNLPSGWTAVLAAWRAPRLDSCEWLHRVVSCALRGLMKNWSSIFTFFGFSESFKIFRESESSPPLKKSDSRRMMMTHRHFHPTKATHSRPRL